MKRILRAIMLLGLLFFVPLQTFAEEHSGSFKTLSWIIDNNGQLTINGSGSIPKEGPWLTFNK